LKGDGVPNDDAKALDLFQQSAGLGNAAAQLRLGMFYYTGVGVQKNPLKAATLFEKSAEQGNAGAQYFFGLAYFNGEGVPKDVVLSYAWANLAAAQDQSKELRDAIEKVASKEEIQEAQRLSSAWKPGQSIVRKN
jgi:TPR repeat protein